MYSSNFNMLFIGIVFKNFEKITMSGSTSDQNLQGWGPDLLFLKNSKSDSDTIPGIENWIRGKRAKITF